MFSSLVHPGGARRSWDRDPEPTGETPPPTPVKFPNCVPKAIAIDAQTHRSPLVHLLRSIQRPSDVRIEHLEALGLHVIPDVPPCDLVPDNSCLPPASWASMCVEDADDANISSMRPLSNGRDSPGLKTYVERVKELSIPNPAAFRTVRRIPCPVGETPVRLGNAYEFFKCLELLTGFWIDTSRPAELNPEANIVDSGDSVPRHQRIYQRIGTGSQMPPEYRSSLLESLIKFVCYDFGCNVSHPRIEPRLYISSLSNTQSPATLTTSSFPANHSMIYRTPTARASARAGIVEGPLAALCSRSTTSFSTQQDSVLDLCREVASALVTAQQRAREFKEERKLPNDIWWCHKPRWGGGPGGPIGREADKADEAADVAATCGGGADAGADSSAPKPPSGSAKRSRKTMTLYDNYRMVRPPSSTWDRKAKYLAIGKPVGADCDDIFLLSALFHHISIVRMRVPICLLEELEGQAAGPGRRKEPCVMWRSKWYDMFLVADRVEAMTCIWGMMAYLMRKLEDPSGAQTVGGKDTDG